MASLLASQIRTPRVYLSCQLPVITNSTLGQIDPAKLGSELFLDNPISLRLTQVLEIGSDAVDIKFDNTSGAMSPISPNVFSRYFYPGSLDNKVQLFLGLENNGTEEVYPKGVYITETTQQESAEGINELTLSCMDQFQMFTGNVYTQFPPKLYGNQQSANYNPNYALSTTDGKVYTCDAVNWMTAQTTNGLLSSDYIAVSVYSSSYNKGVIPVPNSGQFAYTLDYVNGQVRFTNAQNLSDTISVDARPQAMAPELMLQHLFSDFGFFNNFFMKFDNTGVLLPVMEVARDRPIIDIAKDIVYATAPRGIQWQLYFDENGFLNFCEPNIDGPPVKSLVDEVDVLHCTPEYTSRDISNVARATATLNNGTNSNPITQIAYDVNSISVFGQKPTYDIPSQMLATIPMMDPGTALSLMGGMCTSALIALSTPTINVEVEILPDPSLQVGDPISLTEKKTGIAKNFYINQITHDITNDQWKQTLRLTQFKGNQDFQFGLQANIGAPAAGNPNAVETQTGLISYVWMQNKTDATATYLVQAGLPAFDTSFNPILFNWNGGPVTIGVQLTTPPAGVIAYIWRWFYLAEDAYVGTSVCTGDGSGANVWGNNLSYTNYIANIYGSARVASFCNPYDVANGNDTTRARRFYWPLMRCSSWLTQDGIMAITSSTPLTDTYSAGPGAVNPTTYGNLRIGQNDYFTNTTKGFVGVKLYNNTYASQTLQASSSINYGVDFGPTTSQTINYGIHRKVTPGFLCIFVATTAGTMQFKRIPFNLTL